MIGKAISILRMTWNWEGGKWRKHYFLHPWRLYYVLRDQWPDRTYVAVPMDDGEAWKFANE